MKIKVNGKSAKAVLMGLILSIPVVGVLLFFAIWAFLLGMTIYGLYLAFSASIILGIIVFVAEPSPLIIGLVMFFFNKDLAQMLVGF